MIWELLKIWCYLPCKNTFLGQFQNNDSWGYPLVQYDRLPPLVHFTFLSILFPTESQLHNSFNLLLFKKKGNLNLDFSCIYFHFSILIFENNLAMGKVPLKASMTANQKGETCQLWNINWWFNFQQSFVHYHLSLVLLSL